MGKLVSTVVEVGSLGLIDDPLGIDAGQQAIQQGTAAQLKAGEEARAATASGLAQTREDLNPFRQAGVDALPTLQGAIDDPSSRVLNNPFFKTLAADQEQRLLASQAARGKVGSGETGDNLTKNLLMLGNQFAQQDITNLQNLTSSGQNAAARTGAATTQAASDTGNILLQGGNVQAAGGIADANVASAATRDVIGAGTAILGAVMQ